MNKRTKYFSSLKFFLKHLKGSQQGVSLAEVMAGVAIIGITTMATSVQMNNVNKNFKKFKAMHSYSAIASDIGSSISSTNIVLESLNKSPNNTGQISNCVISSTPGSALDCNHNSGPWGFVLYRSGTNVAIAGSSKDQPVYYDTNGEICDNASKPCIFRAYTTVTPHCINEETQCFAAQSLSIAYHVELNENAQGGIDFLISKGWITKGKQKILEQNSFETNLQTNLVALLDQGANISCQYDDNVLQGVTLRLEPICVQFTTPTKGDKGDKGDSIKGDTGGRGRDAPRLSGNIKDYR